MKVYKKPAADIISAYEYDLLLISDGHGMNWSDSWLGMGGE